MNDPNRNWLAVLASKAETEVPYAMQMGRYVFFVMCAWGMALTVTVVFSAWGFERQTELGLPGLVGIAAFLALRDMSKPWDMARKAAAIAMEAATAGETPKSGSTEGDSAGLQGIAEPSSPTEKSA